MELLLTLLAAACTLAVVVLAVPVAVFSLQVLLGARATVTPRPQGGIDTTGAPSITVLVPAHDEATGIVPTLVALRAQLNDGDRVLVVADNCSDDTASVARHNGVDVVEREDADLRGKGYALDFGVRHLGSHPPDVVIVVDADCIVEPGALHTLAARCVRERRPVQALYLMRSPAGAPLRTRIAEFAWRVRNQLRPLGCVKLGWPCQLMGTGMAFPWAVIETAPLASGHLVEDLELGLTLAERGRAPVFEPAALVWSTFPVAAEAIASQRTRWEHGHLGVIFAMAPRLAIEAIRSHSASLFAMLLDLCVPPIAALVLLLVALVAVASVVAAVGAGGAALAVAGTALTVLFATLILAWLAAGRDLLSARELASIPGYVLGKIGIYRRLFGRRQTEWVRTRRDDGST